MSNLNLYGTPEPTSKKVGKTLVSGAVVGTGVWVAAGILPFVAFPPLAGAVAVVGAYAYFKRK